MTPEKNERVTITMVYNLLKEMEEKIDKHYVRKNEFKPVRTLVYGFTGLILTAVIGAGVVSIITKYVPVVMGRGGI